MKKWLVVLALSAALSGLSQASTTQLSPVNINTATVQQLESINGIGAKRAQAIVDYRKQHGEFKSLADLAGVKGISANSIKHLEAKNPKRLLLK